MSLFDVLMLGAQETARSLSRVLAPDDGNSVDSRRAKWLRHYERADQPRLPMPVAITPNTLLLLYMFSKTIRAQGVTSVPSGTRLLLAANCLPFLKPGGFPSPKFNLSPFMVVEQRQWYRLVTTAFLHIDIDQAVSNGTNLMISASFLESRLPRIQFAALTASLGLTSHSLYVLLSWSEFCLFGSWQSYFRGSVIGASGLCFALQVVADHLRGGQVSMMGSGFSMPARFCCWASLAVSQVLVPQASLTGHVCGVIAGLAHVYIPKAGTVSSFATPSTSSLMLLRVQAVDMSMLTPCLMLTVMLLSMVPVILFPMQTLDEASMKQKQNGFMLSFWRSVREAKWRLERRTGTERRRLRQAWAGRADQEHPVEFGGRRWPDLAVHAACLCAALLARALLSNSQSRQHR